MYRKHLSRSTYDDHNSRLLFKQTPATYTSDEDDIYFLSDVTFENNIKLDWPPPFECDHSDMFVFGSVVNGILCVYQGLGRGTTTSCGLKVVLWNPSTEEFKVIPDGSIEHKIPGTVFEELPIIAAYVGINGFGYDPVTDDYKLIRRFILSDPHNNVVTDDIGGLWQVYSLKSNCWRDLQVEMPSNLYKSINFAVHLHGMCHWLATEGVIVREEKHVLVSFNLSDETFIRTPLIHVDHRSLLIDLVVLKESIALMENDLNYFFMISILGEPGVAESVTRLFRIGPLSGILQPIGVGKNGDIFYVTNREEITKYNLNTEMVEEIGVRGRYGSCQVVIYNESLLPIGGLLG